MPYRDAPPPTPCPRCGQTLEQLDRDVRRCIGCHGVWAAKSVLDIAAKNWQRGAGAWWQAELACPEPHGQQQLLTPRNIAGVTIDVCNDHGAWFDQGELARILGSSGDDLAALRAALPSIPGADEITSTDVSYLRRELDQSRVELRRMQAKVDQLERRIAELSR
ncbi:MAG: zf-TFIIB domain-containing protein [Kofleriaceae bacterium]